MNTRKRHTRLPAAAVMAISFAAGCGDTSSSDNNSAAQSEAAALTGKKPAKGGMPLQLGYDVLGDKQAGKKLTATDVYCGYDGDNVILHAYLRNGLNAHVTAYVERIYFLADAGKHGSGITNHQDVGIDPQATREWTADLGAPAGVNGSPKITGCAPRSSMWNWADQVH